jgi:DNA polymerase II small subunit/DNA polymerase delta subunit B
MRGDFAWAYMIAILQGNKYEPITALRIADELVSGIGTVTGRRQYLKLSERLSKTNEAAEFA